MSGITAIFEGSTCSESPRTDSQALETQEMQPDDDAYKGLFKEIGDEMRKYVPPKERLFVHIDSPEFRMAAAYLRSCINKYRFRQKKGFFLMRCCNVIWFGSKPDPCSHIIDDEFRVFSDTRNQKDFQANFNREMKLGITSGYDLGAEDYFLDLPLSMRRLVDCPLTVKLMIRSAKFVRSFDEASGLIGLPAIVISSHGRPAKEKQHITCFYADNEHRDLIDIKFRTSVLHVARK